MRIGIGKPKENIEVGDFVLQNFDEDEMLNIEKIYDKIKEATHPEFADETAINPFHPQDGANFKLKVRKVAGYINYDKSEFSSPEALFDSE